jgi:hypothetical protein
MLTIVHMLSLALLEPWIFPTASWAATVAPVPILVRNNADCYVGQYARAYELNHVPWQRREGAHRTAQGRWQRARSQRYAQFRAVQRSIRCGYPL